MKLHSKHLHAGILVLAAVALPAYSATLSFTGVFSSDDDIAVRRFEISTERTIAITAFGYAGGVNGAGDTIPSCGFDTFISLFDASGPQFLLAVNDDGGCGVVQSDPVSGACFDSYMTLVLPAGAYLAALTQSGNPPLGPAFPDGFLMTGAGNFTGGPFLDAFGNQRDGHWAFDIANVDAPEPPYFGYLTGIGLCIIGWRRAAPLRG